MGIITCSQAARRGRTVPRIGGGWGREEVVRRVHRGRVARGRMRALRQRAAKATTINERPHPPLTLIPEVVVGWWKNQQARHDARTERHDPETCTRIGCNHGMSFREALEYKQTRPDGAAAKARARQVAGQDARDAKKGEKRARKRDRKQARKGL